MLPRAPTGAVPVIGVDDRNGYDDYQTLASGPDFDDFRATILGLGFSGVAVPTFNTENLVGLDVLILNQPYRWPFQEAEIAAVHAFVENGGGLLFHGDGGGVSDQFVANVNELVAGFGVQYAATASDGLGHTISGFVAHPVTDGLSLIGVDFQRRLVSIQDPAIDLTLGSGADDAIAAVDTVAGTGPVVLLSDTSLWADDNVGSDTPLSFGDNVLLLENIVRFIASSDAVCGDGILDPGEECDDGNNQDGDGCSSDCRIEALVVPATSGIGFVALAFLLLAVATAALRARKHPGT